MLEAAEASLKALNKNDIAEVKAMKRPPVGVLLAIEAICIVNNIKPHKVRLMHIYNYAKIILFFSINRKKLIYLFFMYAIVIIKFMRYSVNMLVIIVCTLITYFCIFYSIQQYII